VRALGDAIAVAFEDLRALAGEAAQPPDIGAEMVKTARKALSRALDGAMNTAARSAGKALASRLSIGRPAVGSHKR
jgi:hypothetical protein